MRWTEGKGPLAVGVALATLLAAPLLVLEALAGSDGVERLHPMLVRAKDFFAVAELATVLAVVWLSRSQSGRRRVALGLAQLVLATVAAGLLSFEGVWPTSMRPVARSEGPGGRVAHIYGNGSGCFEVYVATGWRPWVRRVGVLHDEPALRWGEDGVLRDHGEPVPEGRCRDWL